MKDGGAMGSNTEWGPSYSLTVRREANLIAKSGRKKVKKGIWEEGQRVMWIDSVDVVAKIEAKEVDYRSFMKNPEN